MIDPNELADALDRAINNVTAWPYGRAFSDVKALGALARCLREAEVVRPLPDSVTQFAPYLHVPLDQWEKAP